MKRALFSDISFGILIICGLLNLAFNIKSIAKQDEKAISLEEFNLLVNKKNTLVLAYFSADWCTVCAKMKPILRGIERDYATKKMEVLRINTDRDREITKEFGGNVLPVFMIYKNGCREWIHIGLVENHILRNQIKFYL
ncbi:MAG: thioredoxin family protein [Bacteroidetes bacterium]|nr:thioredoxin family protein [Bacteroidota bacterium]